MTGLTEDQVRFLMKELSRKRMAQEWRSEEESLSSDIRAEASGRADAYEQAVSLIQLLAMANKKVATWPDEDEESDEPG